MNPGNKHSLKFFGSLCGFGMTWVLIIVLMIGDMTEYGKRKVEGNIPDGFPVIVRVDDRAQIVWGHNLTQYLEEHPDSSFLIPKHQTAMFDGQINSNTSCRNWHAAFTVNTIAPGKQAFKVHATCNEDSVNVGWYEATDKEVFPQHHTSYFGPAVTMKKAPLAGLIALAIWIIVPHLIRRYQ